MPIEYTAGSLLANEHKAQAVALACNTEGVMNTIQAIPFRDRYPRLQLDYQQACQTDPPLKLGDVFVWQSPEGMTIIQLAVMRDRFATLAPVEVIVRAYESMYQVVQEQGIQSIAMPPIGGGMGALNWSRVRRQLERVFKDYEGTIYIYMKETGDTHADSDFSEIDEGPEEEPVAQAARQDGGRRRRSGGRNNRDKRSSSSGNKRSSSEGSQRSGQSKSTSERSGASSSNSDEKSSGGRSKRRRGRGRGRGGRSRNKGSGGNSEGGGSSQQS